MKINPIYLRLYSVTTINSFTDAVGAVALPLAFLEQTGSVSLAASLSAATTLPQLLFAIPLGAMADRLPKKLTVTVAFFVETVLLAVLAGMLWTKQVSFWAVVLVGAVRGIASQLGVSASAGYVPRVLGREQLLRYHARVETIEGLSAIGGPPIASGVVSWLGGVVSMLVPSLMSAVSGIIYFFLPRVDLQSEHKTKSSENFLVKLYRDMVDGIIFTVRDSVIRPMLLIQFSLGATTTSYTFGVITHLKVININTDRVGLIMAASGIGGIVASFLLERIFSVKESKRVLFLSLLGVCIILGCFTFVNAAWFSALLLFLLDFCWVGIFIYAGTLSQYGVKDDLLARVESICDNIFLLASAVVSSLAAWIIPALGDTTFMLICAATALLPLPALLRMPKSAIKINE